MSKEIKKIIYMLHPLERKLLPNIDKRYLDEIAKVSGLNIGEAQTGIDMLCERGYVVKEKLEKTFLGLDKLGIKYKNSDLPEIKFLKQIIDKPKLKSQLKIDDEEFSAALGILKKDKLVEISKDKDEMKFTATADAKKYLESFRNELKFLEEDVVEQIADKIQLRVYEDYKLRKGFVKKFTKAEYEMIYTDSGEEIAKEINKKYKGLELIENLETDMMKTGSWKGKEFRHYKVNLDVPIQEIGRRHPMIESNNILRDIFVEMGFVEMQGPMVETAFWNMDLLWIPQDHPARDEQDTFYLEGSGEVKQDLIDAVKLMHEEGIKRTHTLKNEWSEDITKRRLLRTHSTSTTFRYLYDLGKKHKAGENVNGKYFYVAHNFRNEAIDATHLAEFFQAEGFIIANELSLADLMGFIREYYLKLGIDKIRFKPTFNPYTEPSMEAHYYDPKMRKWYALINSGIFRKETLEPLGLGDKTIIAWGMGASRVATLLTGANSMRDITGATCDFEWLRSRPVMKRSIVRGEK